MKTDIINGLGEWVPHPDTPQHAMSVPAQRCFVSDPALAARITRAASQQTYHTIRFLVDSQLVDDAYRAYAYFRWVDDWLDDDAHPRASRLTFLQRQQTLISLAGEQVEFTNDLAPEERLVVDLLRRETDQHSGLHAYVHNLMSVMAFDAERRGRLVTQLELTEYTHWLAVAVTEAMHYFIGHDCQAPHDARRYQAVIGAHITHMLRDTIEDVTAGYYNIPREVLASANIAPSNVESQAYRDWVQERVAFARSCFGAGRDYLADVESSRCRLAAYAYMRRFEGVLDRIEQDSYLLQARYPEQYSQQIGLFFDALWMAQRSHRHTSTKAARW